MIPVEGSDPELNIVSIGAMILKKVMIEKTGIDHIISFYPDELGVSVDHVILTLDWLFTINAIGFDGSEVYISNAR